MSNGITILIAGPPTDTKLSALPASCKLPLASEFKTISTPVDLLSSMDEKPADILLVDAALCPTDSYLNLIRELQKNSPALKILPLIPADSVDLMKELLEMGVTSFLQKPFSLIEAESALFRAIEALQQISSDGAATSRKQSSFHGMIGGSPLMQQLFSLIKKVAEDDLSTVLIRGESGTGKEMVAKAIHQQSKRKGKNFVPVNCAAIPDDLLESELFGYTKGAFTGATANKPGRIQYADQGTLFLDEIGDMKASLQAKLLRVIQEKEFEPVGAFKSIPVNTRILAATHCDLEKLVEEGTFREDLYYRLSVVPLKIPALRDRVEDIPQLIEAFLEKYATKRGRERFTFSHKAKAATSAYPWPGNVRELENLIQHMTILFSGKQLGLTDLPEKFHDLDLSEQLASSASCPPADSPQTSPTPSFSEPLIASPNQSVWQEGQVDFKELVNDFETQLIIHAMKMTGGNKKEAARLLNLKRTTLLEKIKKKEISGDWDD